MQVKVNRNPSLLDLYNRTTNGELILPEHQRKDVWERKKKKKWWKTIEAVSKKNGTISGMITTYVVKGQDDQPIKLNDGAQRIYYSLMTYVEDCKANDSDWEKVLRNCYITEQFVEYDNSKESIDEFYRINALGTLCTPYELTMGIFAGSLSSYEDIWLPKIEKIHAILKSSLDRLGCKVEDEKKKRTMAHKRFRDNISIFHKFFLKDKGKEGVKVGANYIDPDEWERQTKPERELAIEFNKIGPIKADEIINKFEKYINDYTALYAEKWSCNFHSKRDSLKAPSNVQVRWWLFLSIYIRNNDYNLNYFANEFTPSLIAYTEGRTSVFYKKDNKQNNCSTVLGNLTGLSTISNAIGCQLTKLESRVERNTEKTILKPGVVNSHIESFSVHGNGQTLPENAVTNRLRGNRDMDLFESL